MRFLLCLLLSTASTWAQASRLDRPVSQFRLEKASLPIALRALGRACDVNIVADPDVTGEVTVELSRTTLRGGLAAIVEPAGYYFEESAEGIAVRFRKTVLYTIDYPQLVRSGSGSASITLGGANGNGVNGNGYGQGMPVVNQTAVGANGQGLVQTGSDATQVSIQQQNQNTFWNGLEGELRAMLKEGDGLVLNKFSGVAQVTAPVARQERVAAFVTLVNRRITQQVEIEARLVEVTLTDERKLGVDWELAGASLGGGVSVDAANAPLEVTGVAGRIVPGNTFSANLGFKHVSAVIHALQQQGNVKTVAQPRLRALNNQTSFIKVGEDRPFFRLQQSTTIQQPGTQQTPFNQTQENFSVTTITIGTILAVTPQIDAEGVITLDILPAITRLQSIVTSPDGRQTAPVTEVKQASTIVRLRDGETAVIGGLISEESGQNTRSVPGLGKVPVVGQAFRSKASVNTRTELVIFLTPKLVRNS